MSSGSIEGTGVQSKVVSGAVCAHRNVAERGVDDGMDIPVGETLAKELENNGSRGNNELEGEGLEREEDSVGMEVDFARESDSGAVLMDLDPVVDERGANYLEGQRASLDVEGNCGGVDDSRTVLGESRDVIDDGNMKGGFNVGGVLEKSVSEAENNSDFKCSVEGDQLVQKPLNDDGFGREVKAAGNNELLPFAQKTADGKVVGVSYSIGDNEAVGNETMAVRSTKVSDGINVKEGVLEPKGVDVVVTLDERAHNDGENSKKNTKFCASDLVWGKVRSHPWWPGQIFEPGNASDKARKHFRPNSYLVAYFGDHTFAWNDKAKLKPFVPHFSQMLKQTSMEAFRHAVDCALDEVSRRVEFGLSCRCITDDVYSELKTQAIENAGVQEQQFVHEHADRWFCASSFEPGRLLGYISSLALEPHAEVDRLKHVMAQGRISAFYRWKGYYHLPEFGPLIGYVNNKANALVIDKKDKKYKVIDHQKVAEGTTKEHSGRPHKRKNLSGNDCRPIKKEKCLADTMLKRGSHEVESDEKTEEKVSRKSIPSSSSSRKASKSSCNSLKTEKSGLQSERTTPITCKDLKSSFRVGESILRAASELSQAFPLLKVDVLSHGKAAKAKGGRKQTTIQTKVGPAQHSSDEILSNLQLAAKEPLKAHGMLTSMVNFFSDFRNSVVQEDDMSQKHEESGATDIIGKFEEGPAESETPGMARRCSPGGTCKVKASDSEITASDFGAVEDACCNKVASAVELHTFPSDENEAVVGLELMNVAVTSAVLPEMQHNVLGSVQQTGSQSAGSEHSEKMEQEDSPTALTLKFTDVDSIPSEAKLNKIFSQFGPLRESETQILTKKNCARVVFKRCLDAETAFSSSGKFEIFGPSLVCYRLNAAPSPRKSTSVEAKQRGKEGSPE